MAAVGAWRGSNGARLREKRLLLARGRICGSRTAPPVVVVVGGKEGTGTGTEGEEEIVRFRD